MNAARSEERLGERFLEEGVLRVEAAAFAIRRRIGRHRSVRRNAVYRNAVRPDFLREDSSESMQRALRYHFSRQHRIHRAFLRFPQVEIMTSHYTST